MRIDRQYVEFEDNSLVLDSPKSAAGARTVHIRRACSQNSGRTSDEHAGRELIFTTGKGDPLSRGGFRSTWVKARERAGLPDFRFHDLRHTGNTLAATTKELMARMGHASMRAALIYQHATADRDASIAAALSGMATEHEDGGGGHAALLRLISDLGSGGNTVPDLR